MASCQTTNLVYGEPRRELMVATRAMQRRNPQGLLPGLPQRMRRARRWIKRYRPNDVAHRHRLEDDQPKAQQVHAYIRRR